MSEEIGQPLLAPSDIPPVRIYNALGRSPFLLLGDHAGNAVPSRLGSLGLEHDNLGRHIGWDIGIAELGTLLAELLDAPFISQAYSRLVIDCNRDPARADAIVAVSDGTPVPANHRLGQAAREARVAAIHRPYHDAIAHALAHRDTSTKAPTLLVSLHSFTPTLNGVARPWEIGVLHEAGHDQLARALLQVIGEHEHVVLGDNEPYAMDGTDYTIPHHAYSEDRPCVELEIRQDFLATQQGCQKWAARLRDWLTASEGLLR